MVQKGGLGKFEAVIIAFVEILDGAVGLRYQCLLQTIRESKQMYIKPELIFTLSRFRQLTAYQL